MSKKMVTNSGWMSREQIIKLEANPTEACGQISYRAYRKVQGPIRWQFESGGGGWLRKHNQKRKPKRLIGAKYRPWNGALLRLVR
jgi:hypothetical protein